MYYLSQYVLLPTCIIYYQNILYTTNIRYLSKYVLLTTNVYYLLLTYYEYTGPLE